MIPFETLAILPSKSETPARQARICLRRLEDRLGASGRDGRHVLSLTFFVRATDSEAYRRRKEHLLFLVEYLLAPDPPPASIVAQAPENDGHVALEATVLAAPAPEVRVERRRCAGLSYTVVAGRDVRQVHGSASSGGGGDGTASEAERAFEGVDAVLRREGLSFGHVVRQWNYIEGLLALRSAGRENQQAYQVFNDVRTLAYERSEFPGGYPAATGIGQASGGIVIEFIALAAPPGVRVVPLSNPKQIDAHHYSADVLVGAPLRDLPGSTPPKFERGKLVARGEEEVSFISGTAAILGERSVGLGDVVAQTRTSIDNIAEVTRGTGLTNLRAYVKRAGDMPAVRKVCEAAYGPIPALFVQADVCRDELLVELEGRLERRARPALPVSSGYHAHDSLRHSTGGSG